MIKFRLMSPEDRHFVVSSWTQSYRTAHTAGFIQDEDWFAIMDVQVSKALDRPDVRTIIAYDPTATDHVADIYGFLTIDTEERPPLVYYAFTKLPWRRAGNGRLWSGPGVARLLFIAADVDPGAPFNFVCSTPMARTLERKIPMARWRPLLGRFPKHERIQGR